MEVSKMAQARERSPTSLQTKDFKAGLLYVVFGAAAILLARNYSFGTPRQMGAGFFPIVLGGILVAIGVLCIARSFVVSGHAVGKIAWRPLAIVTGSVVLFGVLLPTAGLPIALVALGLLSASASSRFRLDPKAIAGLLVLAGLCTLLFVRGLNVPLPILGSWFGT